MTSQDAVIDPVSITRALRGVYSTRLLCVAVCHLKVFEHAADGSHTLESLQAELGLAERPANVLLPALRAMGLLTLEADCVVVTDAGRYLCEREPCNLINYIGGEANDPGVLEMVERLRHDGLPGETGISFVKDDAAPSPMDDPEAARRFTLALAGRARLLSPLVARAMPSTGHLLDIACGTGFFAFEWLRLNPAARATLIDTSEVLAVAREFSAEYGDVVDRIDFLPADMLVDPLPEADLDSLPEWGSAPEVEEGAADSSPDPVVLEDAGDVGSAPPAEGGLKKGRVVRKPRLKVKKRKPQEENEAPEEHEVHEEPVKVLPASASAASNVTMRVKLPTRSEVSPGDDVFESSEEMNLEENTGEALQRPVAIEAVPDLAAAGESIDLGGKDEEIGSFEEVGSAEALAPIPLESLEEIQASAKARRPQGELALDGGPKGKFAGEDPNLIEGEDLDIPPFLRNKK